MPKMSAVMVRQIVGLSTIMTDAVDVAGRPRLHRVLIWYNLVAA
jgi:hypothetical protein